MGCDIHVRYEKLVNGHWSTVEVETGLRGGDPFDDRDYALFGFLAGVRNYAGVTPLSVPRGVPSDSPNIEDMDDVNLHSHSWFSIDELLAIDPGQQVENRRCTRMNSRGFLDGGMTTDPGEGKMETLREFLGDRFFQRIQELNRAKIGRVVFSFDN